MSAVRSSIPELASGCQVSAEKQAGLSGSALIGAISVIVILSMIVGSFLFHAHIESHLTSYYRKRTKAEYLARSGLEVAHMLMEKSGSEMEETFVLTKEDDRWREPAERLADGLSLRGLREPLGEGEIILDIVPEPARRNVNLLTEEDWERILEVCGVPEEMWPELIDPFYDWIDKDGDARYDGAETDDHYSTLEPPYMAKNAPLDTVGELLLIRGFDRTILYGGTLNSEFAGDEPITVSGIHDLLTTYGDGKVNVNAATARVLMTLPGLDGTVAERIIEEREGTVDGAGEREDSSFKNIGEVSTRIWDLDPDAKKHMTTDSKIFRVTSVGEVGGVRKEIWCIVEHGGGKEKRGKILRWREQD